MHRRTDRTYIPGDPNPDAPIHPRLTELSAHIDASRAHLLDVLERVPPSHREVAPSDGGWTVAETVDHIAKVERVVGRMIGKAVAHAREKGLGHDLDESPILASLKMESVLDRTVKVTSPEVGTPTAGAAFVPSVAALIESRRGLHEVLLEVDGFALGDIARPHPIFGDLTLYQWIGLVGYHDRRHAMQIEETDKALSDAGVS